MIKLIDLLNEYRTEKLRREMYVNWADKKAIELSEAERINEYEVSQTLDSQNYLKSFIKWLVENDKIDRWRIENNQDYAEYLCNLPIEEYGVEILLMLLAIADEPIDYLCNILK